MIYFSNFDAGGGGPPPSSDTSVTLSGGANSSDRRAVAIHVWRGVDQTTPLDVATTTSSTPNTGQPDPPSITPVTSGAVVVGVGAGNSLAGGATFTSADLINHFLTLTSDGGTNGLTIGMGAAAWTSGAFNPAKFGGGDSNPNFASVAATMALRPASGQTLTFVGGRVLTGPAGSTPDFAVDLTSLTGGIDSAPAVGDIIIVAYGHGQATGSDAPSVVTADYNQVASLFADDFRDARLSLDWKLAE